MIDDLFEKARKLPGCVTFPPAEPEQFKAVDSFLSGRKFAALPDDYRKFLRLSNGYIFNGIEFMGTVVHQRIEKRYVFPDIIQINKPYSKYEYFREKMLIGRVSESFIIYDRQNVSYALIDRINLRTRIELKSFADLFLGLLKLTETGS